MGTDVSIAHILLCSEWPLQKVHTYRDSICTDDILLNSRHKVSKDTLTPKAMTSSPAPVHYQWFYMRNKFNETLTL
jgi:hypothetical protein